MLLPQQIRHIKNEIFRRKFNNAELIGVNYQLVIDDNSQEQEKQRSISMLRLRVIGVVLNDGGNSPLKVKLDYTALLFETCIQVQKNFQL